MLEYHIKRTLEVENEDTYIQILKYDLLPSLFLFNP